MILMNAIFSFPGFHQNLCSSLQFPNSTFHQKSLQAYQKHKDSGWGTKPELRYNIRLFLQIKKICVEKLIKISIAFFHFLYFCYSFSISIHPEYKTTAFLKSLWASLSSIGNNVFDTPDGDALPIIYGGAL